MPKAKHRPQKGFKGYLVMSRDDGTIRGKFKSRTKASKRRDRLNKSSSEDYYVYGIRK